MSFASGFQAGFGAVSSAFNARQDRALREQELELRKQEAAIRGQAAQRLASEDALRKQVGLEASRYNVIADQGATPAQIQAGQAETAAMAQRDASEFGLGAPMQYRVQDRSPAAPSFRVADQAFATQEEAEAAAPTMRTQGLARVYREAGEIEKADEFEGRAMQLDTARRQTERFKREDAFQAFAAENPNATTQELKDAAFKQFKFSPKQWQDAVNTRLGIEESEQRAFVLNVKNKLKGKTSLGQVAEVYNTDPDFDDKTDLAVVPGKNGAVTLNFVDKATGRVTGSEKFDSEAKALEYLNKQATEPETIGTWMLNLRAKEAQIAASNRSNRPGPGTPSLSQKIADAEKALGRTLTAEEKSIMAGLSNRPGLGGDRAVTVKDAGERVLVDGRLMITDGEGGYVAPDGVVPADRTAFLQEAGVPDNLIAQLPWSTDGRTVGFGGKQYNPRDPRDIRELNDDYRRLGANTIAVEEAQRNTPAQQAQRVGLQSPTAPVLSIPAGGGRPVMQGINARQY
jgi:hypothetical protein